MNVQLLIDRITQYHLIKVGYNQEVNVYGYSGDGVDNLGFDEIPYSVNEGYDNEIGSTRDDLRTPQNINYPRAT